MITIKYILRSLAVPPLIYRCLHHFSAHFRRLQLKISRNSFKLFDLPLSERLRSFFWRLKCAFAELLGIRGWPSFPVQPADGYDDNNEDDNDDDGDYDDGDDYKDDNDDDDDDNDDDDDDDNDDDDDVLPAPLPGCKPSPGYSKLRCCTCKIQIRFLKYKI